MFTTPFNSRWSSRHVAPADSHTQVFTSSTGSTLRPLPQVTKKQSLRLALAERMCEIDASALDRRTSFRGAWTRAYPPQGEAGPPVSQLFPQWDSMGYGDNLLKIQAFSRACMSASAAGISPFKHMSRGWKATRLGNSFLEAAPLIENWACRWHGDVRLDPQIQLAVDAFQKTGLSEGTSMGPVGLVDRWFAQGYAVASVAVMANAFASELRKRGQQVSTVGKMQRHEDAHADRGREVRSYLMSVLKHRPACDVMRFELGMSRDSKLNRQEEYDFMLEASARYLRELKEAFGKAIVGDVRKIDRGSTSGYLVHVLLAWDVPSSHELIAIRQAVVDHWNAQSRGIGYLTDCNAVDAFMYRGAGGQLHHYESNESRLSRAVIFLADTDRIIQVGYDGARDGLVLGTVS